MNIKEVIDREKPIKHIKYSSENTNHLTNEKKSMNITYVMNAKRKLL